MKKRRLKRIFSAFLVAAITFTMCDFSGIAGNISLTAEAATVSGSGNANLDFEDGTDGWDTTGTVEVKSDGAENGSKYIHLEPNASITMTITDVKQGSYTLSAWVKGTSAKNNAKLTVSETGGPDSVALLDTWLKADTWTQMGHRNVLVYNGQMKITVESGNSTLNLDHLELALDSEDANTISNWDFEDGLTAWTQTGTVAADTENADTGATAIRLGADSEISQTVSVEPNTKYSVTMRAKVDKQDTFETTKVTSSYRKDSTGNAAIMGELQERTSLGDRINLGVRSTDGTVLRQVPAGTEGYSLVTLTFTTGASDTSVEIYANTKYDKNYTDSVTIYKTEGTELADNWTGNGSDNAYVDNFDIFRIQDENNLRGADVSFLPAIEDLGGKYFANGVQQDCLRILSNHGVNSITNMIFVKAGEAAHYPDSLKTVYLDEYWSSGYWYNEDGSQAELKMIQGGYFDKEHSLELGKRATELGMSYLPSFHYSDTWMSNAKAFSPVEWLDTDYETGYKNTDLAHMQTIVYNYVYDFIKALADNDVNVCGIKHGNEQNGGIVWPVGSGAATTGHAALITASYNAAEDAMPGVCGYVHSNTGYTTDQFTGFFQKLINSGAKMDGTAFSLYGGRSSGNIINMANYMLSSENMRYMDYVNVETGFSFTKYKPTIDTANSSMGQTAYYNLTPNGQYNWLLDYMQAALDVPNPYGQTRGFYYWETDWIPTPGAGSTDGGSADINQRIMFNNGDTSIQEMGSTQPGKAGDMMDSMYAHLMRGCAKSKASTLHTALNEAAGDYSVEVADPSGITLSKTELTLAEGEKERLQPTVAPVDKVLSDSNITYTSADPSIAKVTQDGFVCGVKAGSTTVTATVKGGYSASVNVTVTAAVKADGITLTVDGTAVTDKETKTANLFDKIQLTSSLSGTATNETVIYTSSNPEVASFLGETWQTPDGEMRQETEKDTQVQLNVLDAGTTIITAQSADGEASVSFTLDTSKVDAESVTIDPEEVSISYSRTRQLKATVLPENTTRYKVHWESEDESIATVDETGLVTATGIGDVVIKAVSDDNENVYGTCTVHAINVQTEGVELDKSSLTIQVGSAKTLNALVLPSDAYNKNVSWKSSDESIATVNENGEVTGVAVGGPVTITATTENGGFTAECQVTVQKDAIPVTGITLNESEYYFASDYFSETNQDESAPIYRLTANIEPELATNTDVTWISDTPDVATVDEFGRVTAISAGVATITATTKDGGFTAQTKVYVPSVSESFDNRETGDNGGTTNSAISGIGAVLGTVTEAEEGNTLQFAFSGSGDRGCQKAFAQKVVSDKVIVDFDWNVGKTASSDGCYLAITDSNINPYLALQVKSGSELGFKSGGTLVKWTPLADTTPVGSGFNTDNIWYHVHASIDMKEKKTTFTITSKENPELTATQEVAFDSELSYTGDVATFQLHAVRTGGTMTWNPALDNINVYPAAPVAKGITVNTDKVKLIPITDTLGAKYQLSAQVSPASVAQEVVWESSDTSLVKVDENGLVTPVTTYDSLDKIVTGSCTIKVASASDPSIYKEIAVEVSNSPNASEFFSIKDEEGNSVYEMGTGASTVKLETGSRKQYIPVLTGGDGDTDIAGIKWESDNEKVVSIDADNGKLTAVGAGTAKVTLTVTLYTGNPLVGEINFEVAGDVLADTSALEAAITAAKAAKSETDDYYTEESLAAYKDALDKAESDLQLAITERWDSTKQSVLDEDAENLNAAAAALEKDTSIKSITISGADVPIPLNKKITLTAEVTPADAEEQVFWSSSDTSVAIVSKTDGTVYPVGIGTATITAAGANGKVSVTKEITVTSDLTSWYDSWGITVTGTNSVRPADNAFINARTMNLAGANNGNDAWTTGSNTKVGEIQVDLGEAARIDNVTTCFWSLMKYTLDVSEDGETWTTVVDHSDEATGAMSDGTEPFVDEFPENTVARYVRINVLENAGTGWVGITIMQVNGSFLSDVTFVESVTCDPVQVSGDTEITSAILPETASAVLSSGETTDLAVTWDESSLKKVEAANAAGEYEVTGTVTVDGIVYNVICVLTLDAVDLSGAQVVLESDSYAYTGEAIEPEVTVVLGGKTLPKKGYTVEYTNNIEVGTASITVTGNGIYTGNVTKTFTITEAVSESKDLKDAVITLEKDAYVYDGKAKTPAVTVTLNGKTLSADVYRTEYSSNINAGTATVTVTAVGEGYTGSIAKTFTITKKDMSKAAVTLKTTKYVYDGKAKTPAVTAVTIDGIKLAAGDYKVSYSKNINAGTAVVTVTGTGNYMGSVVKNFTISKAAATIKVSKTSITKAYGAKNFSLGASVNSKGKLTYGLSNKTVVKMVNGKVKIIGCGKVTVTVKAAATDNYKAASKKITITVTPKKVTLKSVKSKKAGQATVTWKKDTKVTGYQICYSTSKKFKKAKTVLVKNKKTISKTITKLSKGKTYYVKVCAYKTVKGKKIYGAYSTAKKVKIKK